jgi:transcriptional antiterminator NusG
LPNSSSNLQSAETDKLSVPHWYAAHVRSRHEKKVAEQLADREVNFFLPLYRTESRWSDRVAKVELPLFPGYMFVFISMVERLRVLQVPGVVKLVSSKGEPVPLPDSEIDRLRAGLTDSVKAEPHPYLQVGTRVRIKAGAMAGLEGILIKNNDRLRVVINVELIMRSISVEIASSDIEPL